MNDDSCNAFHCSAWNRRIPFSNLQLWLEKRVVPLCAPTDRVEIHPTVHRFQHPPKIVAPADIRRAPTWVRSLLRLGTLTSEQMPPLCRHQLLERLSQTDDEAAAIGANRDGTRKTLTTIAIASWSLCSKMHTQRRCLLLTWQGRCLCHAPMGRSAWDNFMFLSRGVSTQLHMTL